MLTIYRDKIDTIPVGNIEKTFRKILNPLK
jgi:hypothetical protein